MGDSDTKAMDTSTLSTSNGDREVLPEVTRRGSSATDLSVGQNSNSCPLIVLGVAILCWSDTSAPRMCRGGLSAPCVGVGVILWLEGVVWMCHKVMWHTIKLITCLNTKEVGSPVQIIRHLAHYA